MQNSSVIFEKKKPFYFPLSLAPSNPYDPVHDPGPRSTRGWHWQTTKLSMAFIRIYQRLGAALLVPAVISSAAPANLVPKLSYNRDIRPLLSDNCFPCHGPDQNKRKGKLRL